LRAFDRRRKAGAVSQEFGLQRQRPVLRCLGVAPDPVQRPQSIGPTANANAVDVGDLLDPLRVEEVHQLLAQAARGRLARIVALDRLPRQDEPKLPRA
jgi:hypothetical protein